MSYSRVFAAMVPIFNMRLDQIHIEAAKTIEKRRPFDSGRTMPANDSLNRSLKRINQMEGGVR